MTLDRTTLVESSAALQARHGDDLSALVGQAIGSSWVAWERDEDCWFEDEPVIIQIGGRRLEVVWMYFSAVSITWDTIELDTAPAFVAEWTGGDDGFRLEWRRDALEPLRRAKGHIVEAVALAEATFVTHSADGAEDRTEWLLNGIEIRHSGGTLMVFNDLDKNGVSTESASPPVLRRVDLCSG